MSKQRVAVLTSPPSGAGGADAAHGVDDVDGADDVVACCPPLADQALDADQAAAVAPLFKALGDPVRLRLMSMIASTDEACVCDLTDAFDVSAPTISHHLKVLRGAGLVDSERRGTWVHYRARPEALAQLGGLLGVARR